MNIEEFYDALTKWMVEEKMIEPRPGPVQLSRQVPLRFHIRRTNGSLETYDLTLNQSDNDPLEFTVTGLDTGDKIIFETLEKSKR